MIEIYNEAIQDLLIDVELRPKKGLEVRARAFTASF